MKKLLGLLLTVVAVLAIIRFVPPVREAVRPHLPAVAQGWLPAAETQAASADAGKKAGGNAIAVTAVAADDGAFPVIDRTYGIMQSPAVAQIGAQVASQITAVHVKDGQMVKAGDLLVTLDDRALQAGAAKNRAILEKDKALAESAALDLQRAKTLSEKNAGTQQAYDQALAASLAANATVASDQAAVDADTVQLGYTKIIAPISGRLGTVAATVGNLVSASGTPTLMTITQMDPLRISFQFPERDLQAMRQTRDADGKITVQVLRSATTDVLGSGQLDFIDSTIDSASGTITMMATIDNANLMLWPGQHVDVAVQYGTLPNVAIVPTVAIQPGQSGPYVWVVKDGKTVEMRPVTVARMEGDKSAVSAGLKAGEQVVVEGQLRLKPNAAVKVIPPKESSTSAAAAPKNETAQTTP
ncbi:efflux RND transporter periplasmic adaptor subunit [Aestuariivirga sp.]|uniref:efflux RND transporter periplasmic adaptor subunit n=1 Tax=Aestuariivirga sp. TaxID=2650926 RepID=UPI0039E68DB0